jgi:hypothetical protein
MSRPNKKSFRARAALAWTLAFFVLSQLAWNLFVDGWHPEQYDPESGVRLAALRARMAETPGRPLLLLVGSSRTEMSFLPERLPPLYTPAGAQVLPFNFSHLGAGPVMNLLQVRRLLRQGIHPDWLLVEVMPPQLNDAKQLILHAATEVRDMPLVARYKNPWLTYALFLRSRLVPGYKHRAFLVNQVVPQWLPPEQHLLQEEIVLGPLGGDYAWWGKPQPDDERIRLGTAAARNGYFPPLQQSFTISAISETASRELLDLCRREHIQVVMFLSPEGKDFQSWYCPQTRKKIDDYCAALSREFDVPLVDARNWLGERDFVDSHHTCLPGAERFTRRLGEEVIKPLVAGRLHFRRGEMAHASKGSHEASRAD